MTCSSETLRYGTFEVHRYDYRCQMQKKTKKPSSYLRILILMSNIQKVVLIWIFKHLSTYSLVSHESHINFYQLKMTQSAIY